MYFSKYLKEFGIVPIVITVDPNKASYKFIDNKFLDHVKEVQVYRTGTREPLKFYSRLVSGDDRQSIPQGFAGESKPGLFRKISRFIRGNFFIPDARKGWNRYAYRKAEELILSEKIDLVITNGTPHSTHAVGLRLKKKYNVKWICDFRDPWTEAYYNEELYRTFIAKFIDSKLEKKILREADLITTIGPGMVKLLRGKLNHADHNKVRFVFNGYDAELFKGLEKNPSDKFVILHLGILSDNQPIHSFIFALRKVLDNVKGMSEEIVLRFVGKVSPSIVTQVKVKLPDVVFEQVDYVEHKKAITHMLNASLLLNSLAETKQSELLISGKLMEYVATGNPILVLGNPAGDAADLLADFKMARVLDRSDEKGIEEFLSFVYHGWKKGERFPKYHFEQYSRFETTRQYSKIIKELIC